MANQKNGNGMTTRKVATWLGGIAALFTMASCLQIAGIDPPIFDPSVNGGAGGAAGESGSATSTGPGMGGAGGSMGPCKNGEFASCYDGPPETLGVGVCQSGQKFCLSGAFTSCEADIVPKAEDCATLEDEDCDGKASVLDMDCVYQALAVDTAGSPPPGVKDDALFAIIPSQDGGYIVGGVVNGSVNADNTSFTLGDGFVAKFGSAGNKLWEQKFVAGPMSYAVVRGLSQDPAGTIFVVGTFSGTMTVDMATVNSVGPDGFIVKLKNDGSIAGHQVISAANTQTINAVTTDALGNVFVVGSTNAQVDLGGGMSQSPTLQDIFIASYANNGSYRWGNVFVNPGTQQARGIALIPGAGAEVVVAGVTDGAVNLGGMNLPSNGAEDIMLARYSVMDGSHAWSKTFGDADVQQVRAIAVDSNKKILITGDYQGTINWDGVTSMSSLLSTPSVFAARLSLTGEYENGVEGGVDGNSFGYGIAEDSKGNVVITGQFDGELDWYDMAMQTTVGVDSFVVKLDGNTWRPMFGTVIGDLAEQLAWGIATQGDGTAAIVGAFRGSLVVSPIAKKTPVTGMDGFFARFPQ